MKIFAANWKLNKNPQGAREFCQAVKKSSSGKVVIFPPAICLTTVAESGVEFGAQNCYSENSGAFTGENSAAVVKEIGGKWMLLGHSERRSIFGESSEFIAKKLKTVQSVGLTPMLCVGESLAERESGKTEIVLQRQLSESLAEADRQSSLVIAYEPVWAIGTGKVASSAQVAEAHALVRKILLEQGFAQSTQVLYGGSVKPENASELLRVAGVDGFLVGGASLEARLFNQIII